MSRNRRNTRRINSIKDVLNMKTFLIIVSILIIIIIGCIGINTYKREQEVSIAIKQQEEMEIQIKDNITKLNEKISQTNKNISESDVLIKMSAVGDILCSQEMINDAYNQEKETYDFSHMFNNISNYINKDDIVIGTMETGIVNEKYNDERAPIEFAQAVKDSGVNLVTIAHNHSLDNGVEGIEETKENLKEIGFEVVGDRLNNSNAVVIDEVKDTKIAFLTYTCIMDNKEEKTKEELNCINMYSEEQAKEDIEYAKENGAEYICVMIHWGDEITEKINEEQKEIANFLVNSGVDMIIGSHPSVVQDMEVIQNKEGKNVFVAYSIGTYISTLSAEETKTKLVLNIELRKSGKDGTVYLNKVDYKQLKLIDNGENAENRFILN